MKMKVNDVELYYEVHGEGEPMIFVNGWLDTCEVWKSQVEYFSKTGYKVIGYDNRGFGQSDKPKGPYSIKALKDGSCLYSMETLAEDLYALMQKLEIERAILVGHSMGTFISMQFALAHSDKVSKLVLVGAAAKMPAIFKFGAPLLFNLPWEIATGILNGFAKVKPSKQHFEDAMRWARMAPRYASYACIKEFLFNYDIRDRLSEIKIPTLIVVGEHDLLGTPMFCNREVNRGIKGSELVIIPKATHTVQNEFPEEFNRSLEKFIKE
jgi:pimeloyl-ACP methyl ester carboxylesterase